MLSFPLGLILFVLFSNPTCSNSVQTSSQVITSEGTSSLQANILVSNLSNPWELVWGPDGMIWMTEREGTISRVDTGTGEVKKLLTIAEVIARGEGGLLGMALHPEFKSSAHVFVAYNYERNGDYLEKIVRYSYNGKTLTDPIVLLDNISASRIHNGCRLLISNDKKLFITTGDASRESTAQNDASVNGKVLRINLDGSIPTDNPDPRSAAWSKGHRNAQGLVFAKGRLYSSEHGPSTDDELNIIEKGRNYGWPRVEGFCDRSGEKSFCSSNSVAQPIYSWTPTLAVSGLDYYGSNKIAEWENSLLLTTLKNNTLYQLKLNAAGDKVVEVKEFFGGKYGRLRDVCVSPDGKVFISTTNGSNDKIIKIRAK